MSGIGGSTASTPMSSPRSKRLGADLVYQVGRRFTEAALANDDSLFTPGRAIWSSLVIEDLYGRFVQHPDTSKADFVEKFKGQLEGVPRRRVADEASSHLRGSERWTWRSRYPPGPFQWHMYRDTILLRCRGGKGCEMMTNASSKIDPRFSRGMERVEDAPDKQARPRFSRGQEGDLPVHEREHEGEFAAGQERVQHHPEQGYHGRFSRGQERVAS